MVTPRMRKVYRLFGISGAGFFPFVLPQILTCSYFFVLLQESGVWGRRLSLVVAERTLLLLVLVAGLVESGRSSQRISCLLDELEAVRERVKADLRHNPHILIIYISYQCIALCFCMFVRLPVNYISIYLLAYMRLLFNTLIVRYMDVIWTITELYNKLNIKLELDFTNNQGDGCISYYQIHRLLTKCAGDLHSYFQLHMTATVTYLFLKIIAGAFLMIKMFEESNLGKPSAKTLAFMAAFILDVVQLLGIFISGTYATNEAKYARKIIRNYIRRLANKNKMEYILRHLSMNELKLTFFNLIHPNASQLVPMFGTMATYLVILLSYD